MRKWLVLSAALFIAALSCLAQAQAPNVRAVIFPASAPVAAAFAGPLDLGITGLVAIWSLRCSSTSYTGNVADVWDSSTGSTTQTLITCSAGGALNETINSLATTCASGCRIKTLHDQSGLLKCVGGTACDVTQATNTSRPTLSTSCINGKYCGQCTGSSNLRNSVGLTSTVVQPFMVSNFAEQTAGFTSIGTLFGLVDTSVQVGFGNATNTAFIYAGTAAPTATASNSAFHAIQDTLNGASSEIYVDGVANSSLSTGATPLAAGIGLDFCQAGVTNILTGAFTEVSVWTGPAWSSGTKSAMNANQRSSSNGWGP